MPAKSVRKRTFVKEAAPAKAGLLLGYARVSKGDEQNNALQTKALRAAGCRRLFEEAASGGRWDRPELHRLLDHLREGDTVVVWKLDRLSRSLKDVLHIMERIGSAGAGFRSITENIDTTTPAGRVTVVALTPTWPANSACDQPRSRRAALTCSGVSVINRPSSSVNAQALSSTFDHRFYWAGDFLIALPLFRRRSPSHFALQLCADVRELRL